MVRFLLISILFLSGCASIPQWSKDPQKCADDEPYLWNQFKSRKYICVDHPTAVKLPAFVDLLNLPPAKDRPVVAVYSFKDLTVNNTQNLEAHFSNRSRGGKTVTILKGFVGSSDELKVFSKKLKNYFGVGGSLKNGEIIIQGNIRDKIIIYLESIGHKVKRIGG